MLQLVDVSLIKKDRNVLFFIANAYLFMPPISPQNHQLFIVLLNMLSSISGHFIQDIPQFWSDLMMRAREAPSVSGICLLEIASGFFGLVKGMQGHWSTLSLMLLRWGGS